MDIAARHAQLREILLEVADGVHVEQALRGVRMPTIPGIDHMQSWAHVLCDHVGRAALCMPHDEHVGIHRRKIVDGVEQRLALGGGRGAHIQIHHVGRQARGGNFKRGARARAVLEKQVEDRLAAQQRHFLHCAITHLQKRRGGVKDMRDDVTRQAFDSEQMAQFAMLIELRMAHYAASSWNVKRSDVESCPEEVDKAAACAVPMRLSTRLDAAFRSMRQPAMAA